MEVINNQCFYKIIGKYIDIVYLFNHKFAIYDQFFDIIILNINIFGLKLVFSIFYKDNTSFTIFV